MFMCNMTSMKKYSRVIPSKPHVSLMYKQTFLLLKTSKYLDLLHVKWNLKIFFLENT